ncbi:TonB-dependent receptor [uncultured Marixanthomonas sp.]|uniref:TonB-dependent receptor n=1 Tax=uncultured Marixanthomonas sp. TaxID=757245 RepID=UPI0030D9E47F|tara:strand:- start:65965 stop:68703 length:2739 start_codon:yes stop_codon:yes gene_type:complete
MKKLFLFTFLLIGFAAFSQGTISGKVLDGNTNEPLLGANVVETGANNGTTTDFDGNFSLKVSENSGSVNITYVGYETQNISYTLSNGSANLKTIVLMPDDNALSEVVITAAGVLDIAKDRKTPVAVSTIGAEQIQQKLGSQEFPEILSNTPSIYATKQGGGYGDARINIRGFDTQNSAVMINGVPVNDMENGQVYWSNWAGLSDVASAIQVQRGLGSSKLAISSVGGTINVITKSSERKEGGFFSGAVGNNDYLKNVVSYSTGLSENGWSGSFLFSRTAGDGYINGGSFEGYNYFAAIGYKPNENHSLEFTVTGAPQWHHQRSRGIAISELLKYGNDGEPNRKYNDEWGYKDGKEYSFRRNFYHKPVLNLTWDWDITDATKLTTTTYASFGRGGGTGEIGEINGMRQFALPRTDRGLIRVDDIVRYNSGGLVSDFNDQTRDQVDGLYLNNSDKNDNADNTNGITRRASINSHNWYGILANLNTELNENLVLDFGIDLRTYKGFHYRRVNDRLGADAYQQTDNTNNPLGEGETNIFYETYDADQPWWVFGDIDDEEKIDYYNTGLVNWVGAFGQLEYTIGEDITTFVQGSLANQGFAREEFFGETPPEKTDYENILGGNIKGGVNWNIDDNHNVFANGGYYSKQPLFDAVYINFGNNLNPDLQNEKIVGIEAGYGYRSRKLRANVNVYRTSWADRFESVSATFNQGEENEIRGNANITGITQVHMGVEADFRYKLTNFVTLRGMLSVADWQYEDDVTAAYFDNDQTPIIVDGVPQVETLELDGVKVGDAAQFTTSLGADVNILDNLSVDANYRFHDNLYADFDATSVGPEGALKLPSYGLLDAGLSFDFPFVNNERVEFRLNINNVLDETYISESDTNVFAEAGDDTYDGISTSNRVFFGFGRTWNASVRFNF